jgi:hypothetical protein
LLIGTAETAEYAEAFVRRSRACPYVSSYTAEDHTVVGFFVLPEEKRWWIEVPAEHPELLGLRRVRVFFPRRRDESSPWSRGEVEPVLEETPCGTPCDRCPQYRGREGGRCRGCPATKYYLEE